MILLITAVKHRRAWKVSALVTIEGSDHVWLSSRANPSSSEVNKGNVGIRLKAKRIKGNTPVEIII